jgi:hypothetical protein
MAVQDGLANSNTKAAAPALRFRQGIGSWHGACATPFQVGEILWDVETTIRKLWENAGKETCQPASD